MTDVVIINDFLGNPLVICPFQFDKCQYHFSCADGGVFCCNCEECYKTKKCIKH